MSHIDVTSIELRDYAQSLGWGLVREALQDGLFVLNSPLGDGTQLVFPKDDAAADFPEMAVVSISRLSEVYKKSTSQLTEEIREVNDDVISLRYFSSTKIINSLSFEETFETFAATRQLLLSAASSVVNPTTYHPKLNRTEPQDLIKKIKFRHTQEGSFILKIAIPFEHGVIANNLFSNLSDTPTVTPFGRQTAELISQSSKDIIDSIESNAIAELYQSQVADRRPIISYNFCDSLLKMYDEERELPFELIFNWSKASLKSMPIPKVPDRISFHFAYYSKLNEIKEYFAPPKPSISDTFIGTVEELNGDIGIDGRRSGEVVLNLFIEPDIIKAKISLDADQYQHAIEAHQKGSAYVVVKGKLYKQHRASRLDEVTDFTIVKN